MVMSECRIPQPHYRIYKGYFRRVGSPPPEPDGEEEQSIPMQIEELKALVASVSYKPNTRLEILEREPSQHCLADSFLLRLIVDVQDAHTPNAYTIHFDRAYLSSAILNWDKGLALKKVFDLITNWEVHEAKEWFRCGGNVVFDPHASEPDEVPISA
jgi:hypothetical protein